MKKTFLAVMFFFAASVFSQTANATVDTDQVVKPWKKFNISLGGFITTVDSSFRLGSGIGLDIDVEKALNLDGDQRVFRIDSSWRFSKNRKHRLDFSWFSFHREGSRMLLDNIRIENPVDGSIITIPAQTVVSSFFDWDIIKLGYSYSFFQDDRIDLAGQAGLFVMPIGFGLSASGLFQGEAKADFTAPLPTLGLRIDFAITPKWILRMGTEFFYLKYRNFEGSLIYAKSAIEYNAWKHFGIGLGYESFRARLEADGEDYPNIDFTGEVDFNYLGLQLYLRYFF